MGLQPVPGDDLLPRAQLQLEDLGARLQDQVGARIVVHQWRPHTAALHVDVSSSIQGRGGSGLSVSLLGRRDDRWRRWHFRWRCS